MEPSDVPDRSFRPRDKLCSVDSDEADMVPLDWPRGGAKKAEVILL